MLRDIQSKHEAEKDCLTREISIYKRVIQMMSSKMKLLHKEIFEKEKELNEIDKLQILNSSLKMEIKDMQQENKQLKEKNQHFK
mmetsp:Transcript_6610/g.5913  ORF Transcript_6610/g.5913 Transcript_6610/m.5913 type:complete len:84 (+) Transcript_6610:567-818(+)